jgi:N-acetylmuramoyl-L-alanine amidase-like protein
MAKRIATFAGFLLLFSVTLLVAAGCQDASMADDQLPAPGFSQQTLPPAPQPAQAPPVVVRTAPQPQPRPVLTLVPPRRTVTALNLVPADWIPHVPARPWQWIIIHHTATSFGNAAIVTRWHLDRGFDEMGYHFLIGNGTNSGDGQVEVGTRWPKQKWGAHTKSPDNRFNDYGIGICLVGNFDVSYPSAAQMRSVDKLVAYLMFKYHIPPERVLGHDDCKSTDCPGKHLSVALIRRSAMAILASAGETVPSEARPAASGELIRDAAAK